MFFKVWSIGCFGVKPTLILMFLKKKGITCLGIHNRIQTNYLAGKKESTFFCYFFGVENMIPFKGKDSSEKSVGEGLDAGAAEVKSWLVFISSIPTLFTVDHPELTLTKLVY